MKKLKLRNFIMLTIAGIINSIGVTLFLAPVNIYDSGISGTSMLLSQITPTWMSLSFFLIILNVPLFIFGLKKQGKVFTIYAIYVVIIYSLVSFLINSVFNIDFSNGSPLAHNELILCAIFGGLISGVGSGLAIKFGGAMDGLEVLAVIFAKKIGISVGTFVMLYNLVLYVISGIILSSWMLPLYSIIAYFVGQKAVDFIVEGLDKSKAAMIITNDAKKICLSLSEEYKRGITIIDAKGYYSNTDKKIIYIVLNRFQIPRMKNIVKEIDPLAYITITEISDVFLSGK